MSTERVGVVPEFTLGDRLRVSLRAADVTVQQMADYLGVARESVSRWMNDRGSVSKQTMRLWSMRCGVPLTWLETGKAPANDGPGPSVARSEGFEPPTFWLGAVA